MEPRVSRSSPAEPARLPRNTAESRRTTDDATHTVVDTPRPARRLSQRTTSSAGIGCAKRRPCRVSSEPAQHLLLQVGLHPFGHHPQPQRARQRHHRRHHRGALLALAEMAHEGAVDLELADRQAASGRPARSSRCRSRRSRSDADLGQPVQRGMTWSRLRIRPVSVISSCSARAGSPAYCAASRDLLDQVEALEGAAGQVDRHQQLDAVLVAPGGDLARGLADRPLAHRTIRPVSSATGMNSAGWTRPRRRWRQRISASTASRGRRRRRPAAGSAAPARRARAPCAARSAISSCSRPRAGQVAVEDMAGVAPVGLGRVHRDVGIAQQLDHR